MRADFLALVEGKERHAQGIVLCQRLADDLPRLIRDLAFERQDLRLFDVLDSVHRTPPVRYRHSLPDFGVMFH